MTADRRWLNAYSLPASSALPGEAHRHHDVQVVGAVERLDHAGLGGAVQLQGDLAGGDDGQHVADVPGVEGDREGLTLAHRVDLVDVVTHVDGAGGDRQHAHGLSVALV